MAAIKWTREKVLELSALYQEPSKLKKANPSAYKAMRRYKLVDIVYPKDKRQRHQVYTEATLLDLMAQCSTRTEFQLKHPSAYNAARKLGIISKGLPVSSRYALFKRGPYTDAELIAMVPLYSTRAEWEFKHSGSYQVALRKGIIEKYGPPKMQGVSIAEKEVLEFLKTLSDDFKTKRFVNDYELDCYSEGLKLGVEYNGLYWHSEKNKTRTYHRDKTIYFEKLGIRVIHIWEHEWRDRKEQVMDYLRSACGANSIRIGARKCEFKEIEKKVAREFLERCHIQGHCKQTTFALGCFYKDALIGVCTFGRHHRDSSKTVLNRFACPPHHTVSGFLAKASKMAGDRFGVIYSWAHYAKSQAKGYIAAGWKVIKIHPPDYFYSNEYGQVISKQARKKSAVNTPKGMTEKQHADLDGLYRIWDCGKILLSYGGA